MFRLVLIAALVVLSGCGSFQPFATPNVPRPALPLGDPWPVPVEDVIERLQALGYQCNFEPDSDIPGGWRCDRGDGVSVSLDSDEAGPILSAWGYMFDESAPGKEVMDGRAVAVFRDELLAALAARAR